MSKTVSCSIGAFVLLAATFVITHYSLAQSSSQAPGGPTLTSFPSLFIRGYTGYKDLEHCFVRDDPAHPEKNKPLYFEAYTDVKIDSKDKIDLALYDLKKGPVQMTRGSQWDVVDLQDYWFKIKINPDAPPHLGPGPYTATVSATTSATKRGAAASRQWFYPYGTWKEDSSPLDCLYWH